MISKNRVLLASAGIACALAATPASAAKPGKADAARVEELERKLERSLQMIEALSAKVQQLEQAKTAAVAPPPVVIEQQKRVEALESQVAQLGSGLSNRSTDESLPVHGFADVNLVHGRENNAVYGKGTKGFTVGNLDLYLTPKFGDRVRSLIELVFEVDRDGSVATDLERVQMGYLFSDAATAWVGRFHTPYGSWNTAFHHGAQIQTSILRPRFLEFEDRGGIVPAHTTGAWLTGAFSGDSTRLGYDLYFGNAPTIGVDLSAPAGAVAVTNPTAFSPTVALGGYAGTGVLDMRQGGRTNHAYSSGFNAWVEPRALDGLRLGLHGLRAKIEDDSVDMNHTQLRMLGGYLTYQDNNWEVLGEYYGFRNQDISGSTGTHSSWAGYMQAGYNIGLLTPFVRTERAILDQTDNYFGVQSSGRSYSRLAAGIRYDLDPKAALKFELLRTQQGDLGPDLNNDYNEARIQYSVRF